MEIGHQAFARHAYWVDVAVKFVVIDDIVLGEYMDDFLTRIEHDAVLLFDEAVNIGFLDKAMVLSNHYASLVGAAFDVLARNADIDFIDIILGHFRSFAHRTTDRLGSIVNVAYNTAFNAHRLCLSKAHYTYFPLFSPLADEAGNLCCSDVQTYYVLITHGFYLFVIINYCFNVDCFNL